MSRDSHIEKIQAESHRFALQYKTAQGQVESLLKEIEEARRGQWPEVVNLIENYVRALNAKQAKIDRLMMEFCPGEMSASQKRNWARHQKRSALPTSHD